MNKLTSRLAIFAVALMLCALSANELVAQKSPAWKWKAPPSIKNVTLGTSEAEARKILGAPQKVVRNEDEGEMGLGPTRTLIYAGLEIKIAQPPEVEKPYVTEITVYGAGLEMYPGIKVGMSKKDLLSLMGAPSSHNTSAGREKLWWSPLSDGVIFCVHVVDDHVELIRYQEDWS